MTVPNDAPPLGQMEALRLGFSSLMNTEPGLVREQLQSLVERLREKRSKDESMLVTGSRFSVCVYIMRLTDRETFVYRI